jgi:MFS family permease
VITRVVAAGGTTAAAQRLASFAGLYGSLGTMAAGSISPWLVRAFGSRRMTGTFFFAGSLIVALLAYGYAARASSGLKLFLALLPLVGFFTNGVFALYSIWLPEMFPGAHRAFGAGFAFSFGRVLGALGPTVVGILVGITGSYPAAIVAASLVYLIGLPFTFLSIETGNRPLPE